jgi:hypothetical protein
LKEGLSAAARWRCEVAIYITEDDSGALVGVVLPPVAKANPQRLAICQAVQVSCRAAPR